MANKTNDKVRKEPNKVVIGVIIALVVLLAFVGGLFISPTLFGDTALNQYIDHRTCDFIEIGTFHVAKCDDDTMWSVAPFQP